jgi:hypothetical protein
LGEGVEVEIDFGCGCIVFTEYEKELETDNKSEGESERQSYIMYHERRGSKLELGRNATDSVHAYDNKKHKRSDQQQPSLPRAVVQKKQVKVRNSFRKSVQNQKF